ncbi:MAG: sulfite exporter TauE/SafE family protein [Halochromatium sp.]
MTGSLFTAWLVGLLGGVHCVGMCGGIVATLTAGLPRERRRQMWSQLSSQLPFQLAYNSGRILSYTIAGALMGALGAVALELLPLHLAQRVLYLIAAGFMLALGLYLAGWWQGLTRVERLGARLWRRIEPLGRRFLPVRHWSQALAVGLVWGWLPCGLVYSVLIWSAGSGGPLQGALLMLVFGLGTLPNLLGLGLLAGAAARLSEQRWLRQLAGVTVIGFSLYAFWQVLVL